MRKSLLFFNILIKKIKKNELLLMSNALTYRLLIAIFPFIIFIMNLLSFFNIQMNEIFESFINSLPSGVYEVIDIFLEEVVYTKRISLLSSSFILTIYSSSTGFYSIIQGLNRAYEQKETRSFIKVRMISVMLVFVFAFLVNIFLLLFVFGDVIKDFLFKYAIFRVFANLLDSLFFYTFIGLVLLSMILVTYKICVNKRLTLINVLPGSLFTVICWLLFSKIFNIYINNFSKYSMIYGSIGSIFVLVLWINIISFVFLVGGQINEILQNRVYLKATK